MSNDAKLHEVYLGVRCHSEGLGLLRMPLHGMERVAVVAWCDAKQNLAPDIRLVYDRSINVGKTHGTSSVMTSGSSQTMKPPSEVTPANLFPNTAISVTDV